MQANYTTLIASRGWHVYGKTAWVSPQPGESLFAKKERDPNALLADPYSIAWMRKCPSRLTADVVGHMPREISRFVHYFLIRGGTISAVVTNGRYRPSPIPKGGLEILLSATLTIGNDDQRYLQRLIKLINDNYDPAANHAEHNDSANDEEGRSEDETEGETRNREREDPVEDIFLLDDEDWENEPERNETSNNSDEHNEVIILD